MWASGTKYFSLYVALFCGCFSSLLASQSQPCSKLFKTISAKQELIHLKRLPQIFLDRAFLLALTGGGTLLGSEFIGQINDTPLLGLSIYFDFENILAQFSPEEQKVLQKAKLDPERAIYLLNDRLFQINSDHTDFCPFLAPKMASEYFGPHPPQANMCRHKALVLAATLNHLGIPAQLVSGTIEGDEYRGSHVWVNLPTLGKVADPMNNTFSSKENYLESFKAIQRTGVMTFPKPAGLIGR